MKTTIVGLLVLIPLLSGCTLLGLRPKNVEYFQKKVKAVPELSDSAREHQKEAADYVAKKTEQVEHEAIKLHVDPELLVPATEARVVAQSLSSSIGKPVSSTSLTATNIARFLDKDSAKLDKALDGYREKVEPLVGKKIEGTGAIQLGYFTNLLLILAVPVLIWFGLKVYGMFNPVVGLGTNIVGRVGSSLLNKGFTQLANGGERFKKYLDEHRSPTLTKGEVEDLFQRAHMESQDQSVQDLIKGLTK